MYADLSRDALTGLAVPGRGRLPSCGGISGERFGLRDVLAERVNSAVAGAVCGLRLFGSR